MVSMDSYVQKLFGESARVKETFAKSYSEMIETVAHEMSQALTQGNKILFFGNGGSASDASHLAGEFVGRFKKERLPFPAIALGTDMAVVTAIANDYGYEALFARQIQAHGKPSDIAIGITTSGNSLNVIQGIKKAKELGLVTVVFTGNKGGNISGMADYSFIVPSDVTARIQETHITLGHVLCELIDQKILEKKA